MLDILFLILLLLLFLSPVVWFTISLVMFIKHKNYPYDRRMWRGSLIASAVFLTLIAGFAAVVYALLEGAVRNM